MTSEVLITTSISQKSVDNMLRRNAWGYVSVSPRQEPKFFALYQAKPADIISYFAEIESINSPCDVNVPDNSTKEARNAETEDKSIIVFKENKLVRLSHPIQKVKRRFRGLHYVSISKFLSAHIVDDLMQQ